MADEMTKNYKGHVPKTANFLVMTVGHDYISTLIDYDIYGNIKNFKKDVIIIHGTADSRVPIRYSEKAVETYKSATCIAFKAQITGLTERITPWVKTMTARSIL